MALSSPARLGLIAVAGVLAVAGGIAYFWRPWHSPQALPSPPTPRMTPDPRLTYSGPYQNIRPDVKYVGDAVCAECHADISKSYHHHPMGRSLQPIAEVIGPPPEDAKHHNPFTALGREFEIRHEGNRVWQCETRRDASGKIIYEKKTEVDYAIGSGNHGHSYLTNRDGFIYETPMSWFTQKGVWDISPGWSEEILTKSRAVTVNCLFCHANTLSPKPGTQNGYEQPLFPTGSSIGCERCHGPGQLHVHSGSRPEPGKPDYTIVNPGKLPHALREAVCQQCHLEGQERVVHRGLSPYDFRPGLPLDSVFSVFVRTASDEDMKAVNHVEQMYLSRCFEASRHRSKQLGCTSCHDPHVQVQPEKRVAYYRQSCLQCHEPSACPIPVEERRKTTKEDSCMDCHMPRYATTDIAHTASTNHRIIRDPRNPNAAPAPSPRPPTADMRRIPIRLFQKKDRDSYTAEERRDEALALGILLGKAPHFASEFLPMLEESIQEDPTDFELWEIKGITLAQLNRFDEALAAFRTGMLYAPNRESLIIAAAMAARDCNLPDDALKFWRRAAEINPTNVLCQANITRLAGFRNDWPLLKKHADIWLSLDPGSTDARQARVSYLLHEGNREEAKAEFAKIEALQPKNLGQLQIWFRNQMR
ncbi:MAG TPA: cytochrome c3 family protein [Gemmataceae bacterium]|nr:cytochrome c3 family protein [Gemmataceae bacterium]